MNNNSNGPGMGMNDMPSQVYQGPVPPAPPLITPPKKKRRWVVPVIVGVFALFIGVGIGTAGDTGSGSAELETLHKEADTLKAERDALAEELAELQGTAEKSAVLSQEEEEARELELEEQRQELEDLSAELQKREDGLNQRETELTATAEKEKAGTFGEGRWIVGEDVEPGVYKSVEPVTSTSCYWALTTSGSNGDDIISNDFGTKGNHTVTLKAGQDFESQACGQWKLQK